MENFTELHKICVTVFETVAQMTLIFVAPLFLGRIVFSNVLGEGSQVFSILKGLVLYFIFITGFPYILEILFSIPESYLPSESAFRYAGQTNNLDASAMPFVLDRILEVLLAGLYWIVYYLHVFFMLAMCSIAPIVFLTSTLLRVGIGLSIFIGLLIAGSSWPIIWYGFDQIHASLVAAQTDSFGARCLELLITVFKGIAPVAFASLAIKSPAGQLVGKSAQIAFGAGKMGLSKAFGPTHKEEISNKKSSTKNSKKSQSSNTSKNRFKKNQAKQPVNSPATTRLEKAKSQVQERKVSYENSRPRDL